MSFSKIGLRRNRSLFGFLLAVPAIAALTSNNILILLPIAALLIPLGNAMVRLDKHRPRGR